MLSSNYRKIQKTQKTKFRKNESGDDYGQPKNKQKHHDRSYYKLLKQEKKDYEL